MCRARSGGYNRRTNTTQGLSTLCDTVVATGRATADGAEMGPLYAAAWRKLNAEAEMSDLP